VRYYKIFQPVIQLSAVSEIRDLRHVMAYQVELCNHLGRVAVVQ